MRGATKVAECKHGKERSDPVRGATKVAECKHGKERSDPVRAAAKGGEVSPCPLFLQPTMRHNVRYKVF